MLIDFSVSNFRSYKTEKTISLIASSSASLSQNTFEIPGPGRTLRLLRTAAIYGPNASGKSNILAAMDRLAELIEPPQLKREKRAVPFTPFLLNSSSSKQPTRFRVRFFLKDVVYSYALAVLSGIVVEETLSVYQGRKPQKWIDRKADDIILSATYLKGLRSLIDLARQSPGVPFLAIAGAFTHPRLAPAASWLQNNLSLPFDSMELRNDLPFRLSYMPHESTRLCAEDPKFRRWVSDFLRHADFGIEDVEAITTQASVPAGSGERKENTFVFMQPEFTHTGEEGYKAKFGPGNESHGTRRLFALLGPIYKALHGESNKLLLIDEFGESMHPSLVLELVRRFNDPKQNPKNTQLLFSTHDTSLLSGQTFRRDQIWFTEKDKGGASDLYSLQDLKEVREDEAFEKGYLRGRYGAIPFFGPFEFPPAEEGSGRPDLGASESESHSASDSSGGDGR